MSLLVLYFAIACFASFAWGMAWHFRRVVLAAPSRPMLATAWIGTSFAIAHIAALFMRRALFPAPALVMYSGSAALFWWAVSVTRGRLAACGQGCVSRKVVREGPYRYIRHPFYAAYNLAWLSGVVATGWWPLAVSAAVMSAIYECCAREEERGLLSGPQADAYREYRAQTRKYLPRIVRVRASAQ